MAKPRGRSADKKGRKPGAPTARKRRPLLKPEDLDWKNYPSLRRFLSERGKIRARRITGLSRRQQSMLAAAVKRAREMGLLPFPDQDRKIRITKGGEAVIATPVIGPDGVVEAIDGVEAVEHEETETDASDTVETEAAELVTVAAAAEADEDAETDVVAEDAPAE